MWKQGRVLGASSIFLAPPQKKIICPGLSLLVVHVAGPFRYISGMEVGEGMKVMELNVSVFPVLCLSAGGVCEL